MRFNAWFPQIEQRAWKRRSGGWAGARNRFPQDEHRHGRLPKSAAAWSNKERRRERRTAARQAGQFIG